MSKDFMPLGPTPEPEKESKAGLGCAILIVLAACSIFWLLVGLGIGWVAWR